MAMRSPLALKMIFYLAKNSVLIAKTYQFKTAAAFGIDEDSD